VTDWALCPAARVRSSPTLGLPAWRRAAVGRRPRGRWQTTTPLKRRVARPGDGARATRGAVDGAAMPWPPWAWTSDGVLLLAARPRSPGRSDARTHSRGPRQVADLVLGGARSGDLVDGHAPVVTGPSCLGRRCRCAGIDSSTSGPVIRMPSWQPGPSRPAEPSASRGRRTRARHDQHRDRPVNASPGWWPWRARRSTWPIAMTSTTGRRSPRPGRPDVGPRPFRSAPLDEGSDLGELRLLADAGGTDDQPSRSR